MIDGGIYDGPDGPIHGSGREVAEPRDIPSVTKAATTSLGEALPKEMARVRDKMLPSYIEIGPAGALAAFLMRRDLDDAAKALAEGDIVAMVRVYESLKGWGV